MIGRRALLLGGAATAVALGPVGSFAAGSAPAEPSLLDAARALAAAPYQAPDGTLPPPFAGLSYDAYRAIRPRPGKAALLPLGDGFSVDLLPPGLFFPDPVEIGLPQGDGFGQVRLTPDLFSFDPRYFDAVPAEAPGAGFSGLRLRHPLNAPDLADEFLVIQGASYFRAIGRSMVYGLSARAVALGTGDAGIEEFPRFTRLRVHPPDSGTVRFEGVVDSPSLAAHVDMTARPGEDTVIGLSVTVLPRRDIGNIGIAPLTSMYFKGPLRAAVADDFRPAVHDSDVLAIRNGAGEALWRPISNPARIQTSAFADRDPRGFGLFQTRQRFEDFEDAEARYHDRPSAEIRPRQGWGDGAVMLVEIPTGDEFMDNIVAFWRPAAPLAAGSEHRFDYDVVFTRQAPATTRPLTIVQSRSGREHHVPGARRYVVDFDGAADPERLSPDLSVSGAEGAGITGASLHALPGRDRLRATFLLTPGLADAAELRLVLRDDEGRAQGPVWLHRWTRARDGGV